MLEFNKEKFTIIVESYTEKHRQGLVSTFEFLEIMGKANKLHKDYSKAYIEALKFEKLSKVLDSY